MILRYIRLNQYFFQIYGFGDGDFIAMFDVDDMLTIEPNKDCSERHEGTIG
mgnify:CR=1 FL=1